MKTDYASIIKRYVMMHQVVNRYTSEQIVRGRIRCPIHHGTDRNMRVYPNSYYCWVCHAHGDVIQFVQSVLGLSFQDAMQRISDDFGLGLPIGAEPSDAERHRLAELNRKIEEHRRLEDARLSDAEDRERLTACRVGLLHQVEIICEQRRPKTPWDEWADDWCEAMRVRTELLEELK
jgi:DNA primase